MSRLFTPSHNLYTAPHVSWTSPPYLLLSRHYLLLSRHCAIFCDKHAITPHYHYCWSLMNDQQTQCWRHCLLKVDVVILFDIFYSRLDIKYTYFRWDIVRKSVCTSKPGVLNKLAMERNSSHKNKCCCFLTQQDLNVLIALMVILSRK